MCGQSPAECGADPPPAPTTPDPSPLDLRLPLRSLGCPPPHPTPSRTALHSGRSVPRRPGLRHPGVSRAGSSARTPLFFSRLCPWPVLLTSPQPRRLSPLACQLASPSHSPPWPLARSSGMARQGAGWGPSARSPSPQPAWPPAAPLPHGSLSGPRPPHLPRVPPPQTPPLTSSAPSPFPLPSFPGPSVPGSQASSSPPLSLSPLPSLFPLQAPLLRLLTHPLSLPLAPLSLPHLFVSAENRRLLGTVPTPQCLW